MLLLSLPRSRVTSPGAVSTPIPGMIHLPIDDFIPQILAASGPGRNLVIVAEPGAGKTTRVPAAIVERAGLTRDYPAVVVLQPRRVAARTVAERIAEERGWSLGEQVGYHVRFDRRVGPRTRLRVVTEGILTRQLLDDPFLDGVGCVVLDEFHERSLYTDVAIALLREVQTTVRPNLSIVVMSATLSAEPVARFLGDCPVLRVPGRTYPVEVVYRPGAGPVPQRVADAVLETLDTGAGDVLAFLAGADDIRRTSSLLRDRPGVSVLPLHGSLPPAEQQRALRPAPAGLRKVVLATNIAETSLTIDGVRTVIDSGLAKIAGYDPQRGMDRLDLRRISRASADQRAGRAGRTGPGRCVRLWAESESIEPFEVPEIRRVDLAPTVLSLHAWGKPDVREFGWFESPDEPVLAAAERLLEMLGALDSAGQITPIGRKLSNVPTHPRLARLLLAASDTGRPADGATLAALLSEKDLLLPDRSGPRETRTVADSDLIFRMILLEQAVKARFSPSLVDQGIDPGAARSVCQLRDDLLRLVRSSHARSNRVATDDELLRLVLPAYPDRVCRRRQNDPAAGVMVDGRGVRLAPESAVRSGEFFIAVELRHDPRSPRAEAAVRIASRVDFEWLGQTFPGSIRIDRGAEFDPERERVVGFVRTYYRDLLLSDDPHAAVDPAQAAAALGAALRPRAGELFRADPDAESVLERVALLRAALSEHHWPDWSDERLGDLIIEHAAGKRTVAEVRSGLAPLLLSHLQYPLDRLLESEAPATMEVPSGNRLAIRYVPGQKPPTISVRLQEIFGWAETPRIAQGRVRVRVELLGPNYRPVQLTDDLKNFWATTYFQVRKDLRARYPKHAWPEDPLTATAQAKGRPTR
jgi:ATP-dependent helicase HrpB